MAGHFIPVVEGRTLPVFTVREDKRPATLHSFYDATADPAAFADLCRRYPGPLIGVPTGAASGIDITDIDPAALPWLIANEYRLPTTRRHATRRGVHLLFRHEPGLRCSIGRIAPGIDVKSDGGYVIWWPAAGYRVTGSILADWPDWLLELAMTNSPVHRREDGHLPLPSRVSELPPPSSMEEEVTTLSRFSRTVARFTPEESFAKAAVQGASLRVATAPKFAEITF